MEDRKIPERPEPNTTEIFEGGGRPRGLVWWWVVAVLSVVGVSLMWFVMLRWLAGVVEAGC